MLETPTLAPVAPDAETATVGQQTRRIAQPSAVLRNDNGAASLKATIWYPAVPTAETISLNIGPEDAPYMLGGRVAPDAPFATDRRLPVVLFSHGSTGSAATTSWFGVALAAAGYVVVAPDHPGNNADEPQTIPGLLLWRERADDLRAVLKAVGQDPILGPHVDLDRVGVAGFSLGGLTALQALGGVFEGALYDAYCAANPTSPLAPQSGGMAVFSPDNVFYPEPIQAALRVPPHDLSVPNVRAGLLFAPVAAGLRPESLAAIKVPVTLLVGSDEIVTPPEAGAAAAAALIPGSTLVVVPGATHSSFVNIATSAGVEAKYSTDTVLARAQDVTHRMALDSARTLFDPVLKP